jgi:hypothetical protein
MVRETIVVSAVRQKEIIFTCFTLVIHTRLSKHMSPLCLSYGLRLIYLMRNCGIVGK